MVPKLVLKCIEAGADPGMIVLEAGQFRSLERVQVRRHFLFVQLEIIALEYRMAEGLVGR